MTGEQPFNTLDEDSFREDVMTSNVDWSRIIAQSRLRNVLENLLNVDPQMRWDASFIFTYLQEDFAIEIQKAWRGFKVRKNAKLIKQGIIKM